MQTRITLQQLEKMKTHDLADLLGTIALLLRRLPDVEFKELVQPIPEYEVLVPAESAQATSSVHSFTQKELESKKMPELKELAKSLNLSVSGNKAELVKRILARSSGAHSEQYAIQNL